jgi:hypothetical protein
MKLNRNNSQSSYKNKYITWAWIKSLNICFTSTRNRPPIHARKTHLTNNLTTNKECTSILYRNVMHTMYAINVIVWLTYLPLQYRIYHLWADCLDNVGSLTSYNPISLHGLLRVKLFLYIEFTSYNNHSILWTAVAILVNASVKLPLWTYITLHQHIITCILQLLTVRSYINLILFIQITHYILHPHISPFKGIRCTLLMSDITSDC